MISDGILEETESVAIHLQLASGGSEVVLEGVIFDEANNATFVAEASPAVEGSPILLTLSPSAFVNFEYWVEDVSAYQSTDYTDPNLTNSLSWAQVPSSWQLEFPTIHSSGVNGPKSFKIHVRPVGYPDGELVLEALIYDHEEVAIQTVDYAYDIFSQLIRREHDDDGPGGSNPTTDRFFSYQDGQIVLQFDSTTATYPSHRYLWNPVAIDQLLADETVTSTAAGDVLWPLADHLGTIRDIAEYDDQLDETTIADHIFYDAFGNRVGTATDIIFGYTGRLFDEATKLQYNLNRWYDANTGRWTSEDPIGLRGDPTNLYRYVSNAPSSYRDPRGLDVYVETTAQVGGKHKRITVDTYDATGKKNGSFSISFGWDEALKCGRVYQDKAPKQSEVEGYRFKTTQAQDEQILELFKKLIDRTGRYTIFGRSCRDFSNTLYAELLLSIRLFDTVPGDIESFPLDPLDGTKPTPPIIGSGGGSE